MNWIKIGGDIFELKSASVQLTQGAHANIYLSFDLSTHSNYYNYFIKLYESQQQLNKFDITSSKFKAIGSLIKSIDTDFVKDLNLNIKCDYFDESNIQERREEMIDDILKDETLPNKDNIN